MRRVFRALVGEPEALILVPSATSIAAVLPHRQATYRRPLGGPGWSHRPVRGPGTATATEAGDPACKAQLRDALVVPPDRPHEVSSRVRPVAISVGVAASI